MMIPTVHLNGTSKNELLAQVEEAQRGVSVALRAMSSAAPNGRDYYPQGPSAYAEAEREHLARVNKLVDVRQELLALYEAIADGGWRRP